MFDRAWDGTAGKIATLVALAAISTTCGGTSTSDPRPCDPLATTSLPIAAGTLVAAGRDAAGTVYVVDVAPVDPRPQRLFISSGTTLQRRPIEGSGELGAGPGSTLIVDTGSADPTTALQIAIEMGATGPARMGLHRGPLTGKTFVIGTEGELLTLLSQADLAGFTLQNLPGRVVPEHLASLSDGRLILVTRPEVDWSYADMRVFVGPPARMLERDQVHVSRGSYTIVDFALDGRPAQAVFGSSLAPSVVSALTVDGQILPLTVAPPGSRPDGAAIFCTQP
jgi:hypothetical protein